ncbi:MAG: recombination mediator RecR [Deltaproteobacteria bacterium]|nr:recombination mediator RecR [Deltaproteobacteria bacterium]
MAIAGPIGRLITLLGRLPGIGEKSAQRLAFHILRAQPEYALELAEAIRAVSQEVNLCPVCMNLTEAELCAVCADARRDASLLCVVATVPDLLAVDRTGEFQGRYHVLHGVIAPLDGIGPDDIKIAELLSRLREGRVEEVIVATNPDVEGEATALYLHRLIAPLGITVSRLAQGMPMGGDIEYTDQATLGRALAGRRPL